MTTIQLYIIIMIYCVSDNERLHTTALDAKNVALGKNASISSTYPDSGPASLAVDGNTSTTYASVSSGHPNCIHTADNDHNAWWEVDLGRNYTVTNITVYIRDGQPQRMDNVRITVDGKECYIFPSGTTSTPPAKSVSCTSPVQGSVVRLSRNTSDYYLNFCEVQVWDECSKGYYGINCSQVCGICKDDSTCNSTNGQCLAGCKTGWKEPMCTECKEGNYGALCNQTCGKCINSMCNASDGVCPEGCQDGFEPPFCNQTCRNHTYGQNCRLQCGRCNKSAQCDAITGNCTSCETNFQLPKCIDCSNGYYGSNCTKECGNCNLGTTCNTTNGHCMSGCKTGWGEPMCIVCKAGNYGANCSEKCGKCRNATSCNASDGVCLDGCQDGYEQPFCNETCRKKTYGQKCSMQCGRCNNSSPCDVFNGSCTMCESNFHLPMCTECIHGYYGTNCSIQCGHCKEGQMCNNSNGVCPAGCEDGYELPQCHQIGCSNRMYGPNCSIVCGHCLAVRSCNAINGACPDGCDAGYNTTLCNEKCSSGTWGRNCENACGACLGSICRHDNGICEKGCFSGYDGEHCTVLLQHTNDRDLTGVIAGSVVGAGLLIGGSIVTAVLIWLRRSTMKDKPCPQPSLEDKDTHGTSKDNLAMAKVNFHENAYDKLETREDVAKPYEMLGKEIHVDNVMQSQRQNISDDSKPYEII